MYYVDYTNKKLSKMQPELANSALLHDKFDIALWIEDTPDLLDEPLLIIAKDVQLPIGKKVELLALDKEANVVIIEINHDDYVNGFEWQAIKSVSYFADLFPDDLYRFYSQYFGIGEDEAQLRIEEFIDVDLEMLNQKQRIIMVASKFPADLLSSVVYLREHHIDIKCLKLLRFANDENGVFVVPCWIIPIQELKEYVERLENQVKRIRKVPKVGIKSERKELSESELTKKLLNSFKKDSDLAPKITAFFDILTSYERAFSKDEIRNELFNRGLGADLGQAAKIADSITQHIASRSNQHLRQLLDFSPGSGSNDSQKNYRIRPQYRLLVRQVLDAKTEAGTEAR